MEFLKYITSIAPVGETVLLVKQKPLLDKGALQYHNDGAIKCTWPAYLPEQAKIKKDDAWYANTACFILDRFTDGKVSASAANCERVAFMVLDDVGTKSKVPPLAPTWIIESSPDNYQYGYTFALDDQPLKGDFSAAIKAIADAGFTDGGAIKPIVQMNTPTKQLLNSDIQIGCTVSNYERGRDYFARGRVLNLGIVSKGVLFVQLSATVKGNNAIPYKQNIRISWRDDYRAASIEGNCSCPVAYNCKHVAAACLMYQYSLQNSRTGASCLDWLDFLDDTVEKRNTNRDFIIYILNKAVNKPHEFSIELSLCKEKKTGGLSKGRKLSLQNIPYYQHNVNYLQPEDNDIIKLLAALESNYQGAYSVLEGAVGYFALSKLLPTGRLYWQDCTQAAFKQGSNRDLRFNWIQTGDDYKLSLSIEPDAQLLLTDPPQYLDTNTRTIGGFNNTTLTTEQIKKYLSAPRVPETYADEFSMRLMVEHGSSQLPPPKKVAITDHNDLTLTPRLLLCGEQIERHYQHFIALSFQYGQWQCSAKTHEPQSVIKTEQGLVRIQRQAEAENNAVARLTDDWNFQATSVADEQELLLTGKATTAFENTAHWNNFLQNA